MSAPAATANRGMMTCVAVILGKLLHPKVRDKIEKSLGSRSASAAPMTKMMRSRGGRHFLAFKPNSL